MKPKTTSTSKRLLPETALRYRINTHLAKHDQMMIVRGCALGPVFVLDLATGTVVDKNIRSLAALARKRGLVQRWETTR